MSWINKSICQSFVSCLPFLFEALDMLLPDTIYQSLQVKSSSFINRFVLINCELLNVEVVIGAVSVESYWQWTENHCCYYPQFIVLIDTFRPCKLHQLRPIPWPRTRVWRTWGHFILVALQRSCSLCHWHLYSKDTVGGSRR